MSAGAARWWLIRHAPVAATNIVYGQSDVAASPPQPEALRRLARGLPARAVWVTSQLSRARETAAALQAAAGVAAAALVEPDLAEQDFGAWEGRPSDEVWPALPVQVWHTPSLIAPPDGETFADVVARVGSAVARLSRQFAGRDVIAVVHAGSIRAALAPLIEGGADAALSRPIAPLSLTRIDRRRGTGQICFVNRIVV